MRLFSINIYDVQERLSVRPTQRPQSVPTNPGNPRNCRGVKWGGLSEKKNENDEENVKSLTV